MILGAGDVGQDRVLLALHDQSHRDSGARSLQRHARVHHRQRTAADRGHGRRSVRFENVRNHAHGVREIGFRRQQASESALGQRAVTDFAPSGSAQELYFAHRERREIVVQHEPLEHVLLEQQIEPLLVFFRSQRRGRQRLRLAAGEKSRAVRAGQHAHFAGDLANLIERAAIGTPAANQHVVAEDALAQPLERAISQSSACLRLLR